MDDIKFCKWQLEKGESGTPHLQGVVLFGKPRRLAWCRGQMACHWEPKKGSWEQAIAYVSKEEGQLEGPWTIGSVPQPGARSDVLHLREMAESRKRLRDMEGEELQQVGRSTRLWSMLRGAFPPVRKEELEVTLLVGKPGIGKTRFAYDKFAHGEEFYRLPVSKDMWFDGYDGEPIVLIDDFTGQMPLHLLLQILDRYPVQVPVKGGFVWWCPEKIIITSNMHPSKWYDYAKREVHYRSLCRRIHLVVENMELLCQFDKENKYDEYDLEVSHSGF